MILSYIIAKSFEISPFNAIFSMSMSSQISLIRIYYHKLTNIAHTSPYCGHNMVQFTTCTESNILLPVHELLVNVKKIVKHGTLYDLTIVMHRHK